MTKKELVVWEVQRQPPGVNTTLPSLGWGGTGLVRAEADPAAVSTGQKWRRNGRSALALSKYSSA